MAGADTQQVDDMLVFSVLPPTLSKEQRLLKRTMDVVLAAVMLVLASPIMLLLAVLIPLTSRGPAIYRQERLGLNGKPFIVAQVPQHGSRCGKNDGASIGGGKRSADYPFRSVDAGDAIG